VATHAGLGMDHAEETRRGASFLIEAVGEISRLTYLNKMSPLYRSKFPRKLLVINGCRFFPPNIGLLKYSLVPLPRFSIFLASQIEKWGAVNWKSCAPLG
jgi:hypothetical protein